jgi:hypothetical protein
MTPSREQDPAAPEVAPERARDARRRGRSPGRANREAGWSSRPDHREATRPRPHLGSDRQPRSAGLWGHRPSEYKVRSARRPHKLHCLAAGASRAGFPGYTRNCPPLRRSLWVHLRDSSRVFRVQRKQRLACSSDPTRDGPNRASASDCSQGAHALALEAAGFVAGSTGYVAVGVRGCSTCARGFSWR